jgi:hypothetical protein
MGLRGALARLASAAPVPVFVLAGYGGRDRLRSVALDPGVEPCDTPRAAAVLLVAGRLPPDLWDAALAVHDQLPPRRATVAWSEGPAPPFPDATTVAAADDPVPTLAEVHRALLSGERPGEAHLQPDVDPNPWRGVGPYGQGGKGMTGGTPYGRPLAGRAPDRDGLELDQLLLPVGPFFPPFPPGLMLRVKLQGDVVQGVDVDGNPYARASGEPAASGAEPSVFELALHEPVPVAELELARARHHLGWLGDALRVQGLPALGLRAWRLAAVLTPAHLEEFRRLRRGVARSQVLRWSTGPVGRSGAGPLSGRDLGPLSRAAGRPDDARQGDPAYRELGFEVIVGERGGVADRWHQRLAEAEQSLSLAARAGGRRTTPTGVVESPRGALAEGTPPAAGLLDLVPELTVGLEWGDAVSTVVSLDLDLEEAARVVPAGAGT